MQAFWFLARRMLRYKGTLLLALSCAALSAAGLGVGVLGVHPILQNVLGEGRGLPELAQSLNQQIPLISPIPDGIIQRLPEGPFTAVVWVMAFLGLITIFGATTNFLHAYLSLTVVYRTATNLRRQLFHRVLRLPLRDLLARGSSDVISRIVNDTTTLVGGFTALLSKAVAQVLKGIGAFIAALILDWRLTLVACVVAPALAWVIRTLAKRVRRASRKALESQADLYGAAAEALQGLRVVKVHTTERYEAGRFHRINKEVMRQMLRARTARALSSPLTEAMALFVLGGLSLVAAKLILDGLMEVETFLLTLAALFIAAASLKPLTGIINEIQAAGGAAERLVPLLQVRTEPGHEGSLPRLPRHRDSLTFDNIVFTYPAAQSPALRGVNLTVRHGETVAVVGPNGSGKTTLLSLVPRLFDPDPEGGRILIDGTDIREVSVRSLRGQIGVVTQETVLFRGTIASNIAYGARSISNDDLIQAAKRARAHDFIKDLPDGYDTPVGEQGLTLSGGQRQRIAIARAILRNPAILILDEATSMIDADSESQIAAAIAEFSRGRTCLIVAHRLSTVVNADRIVVMDQGRVVDEGTHDELLDRCDTYQLIARHQLVPSG